MMKIGLKESDIDYSVGVLMEDKSIRYVTDYTVHPSVANWEDGKKACRMTKDEARYIALGLCSHGITAVVVEVPKFLDLEN